MSDIQGWVGNREVVAAGVAVIGPKDFSTAIKIGERWFTVFFVHSESPATAQHDFPSPDSLRVTISGKLQPLGLWWDLPNLAVWDGKFFHVSLIVRALLEPQIFREVIYTLTKSDAPL